MGTKDGRTSLPLILSVYSQVIITIIIVYVNSLGISGLNIFYYITWKLGKIHCNGQKSLTYSPYNSNIGFTVMCTWLLQQVKVNTNIHSIACTYVSYSMCIYSSIDVLLLRSKNMYTQAHSPNFTSLMYT